MMSERGDRVVLHEPFSQLADFGSTEVDGVEVSTEASLISAIRALAAERPVFFKDTTDFHYPGLLADTAFLREAVHTFIIRRPAEIIASHYVLNQNLECAEIGVARLSEIFDAVAAQTAGRPVVIDSDDLIRRPTETVQAYCAAVGIPFIPEALSWQAGELPEWTSTRRWHASTSRTTGFAATESAYPDVVATDPTLAEYLAYHQPYYDRLVENRLPIG